MKRLWIISIVAITALLFISCEKDSDSRGEDIPVFKGYMQFSTGVSTRSHLATNMRNKDFGVFGYQYNTTTDWDAAKATAIPKVFYNQKVECSSDGVCTYDIDKNQEGYQFKTWEEQHYSFFAYHPYDGNGISFSGQNDVNTPMLTYTYGWLNNSNQRIDVTASSDIFDLMTAEAIDADGSSNVGFNFKHRLFAVEVLANNYNENTYIYDDVPVYETDENGAFILDSNGNKVQSTDKDGNPIFDKVIRKDANGNNIIAEGGNARQTLGMLTMKLDGLKNDTMVIPMSMSSDETKPVYSCEKVTSPFSREFVISMNDVVVPAYNETIVDEYGERGGGIPTSISKLGSNGGGYLMLIPQIYGNSPLKFSLNWLNKPTHSDQVKTEFESTIDFEPGRLYQIIINFVGSGITIALIEAGSWDPKTVEHTFE